MTGFWDTPLGMALIFGGFLLGFCLAIVIMIKALDL